LSGYVGFHDSCTLTKKLEFALLEEIEDAGFEAYINDDYELFISLKLGAQCE